MDLGLLGKCEKCHLKNNRKNVVIPKGKVGASVMFIGEAPGQYEDSSGVPFTGASGQWFEAAIDYLQLKPDDYYATNIIKCRPSTNEGVNRVPTDLELSTCGEWLVSEINIIKPKVIVLMGSTPLRAFFKDTKFDKVVGEELFGHKVSKKYGTRLFVLYHPAVMLFNRSLYQPLYRDGLKILKGILKEELII
jgi:DNA polymerase